jgi:histone H2B
MAPKAAAEKKPASKAPASKAPAEKKEASKKTAASGDKKKRTKSRKETYSSYIYKGEFPFLPPKVASFPNQNIGRVTQTSSLDLVHHPSPSSRVSNHLTSSNYTDFFASSPQAGPP